MTTTSLPLEKHDEHDLHHPGQNNLHLHQQPLVHMEPQEQLAWPDGRCVGRESGTIADCEEIWNKIEKIIPTYEARGHTQLPRVPTSAYSLFLSSNTKKYTKIRPFLMKKYTKSPT